MITSLHLSHCMNTSLRNVQYKIGDLTMHANKEFLDLLLKTTQKGQISIRSILDKNMNPGLQISLKKQLREYDAIEAEAHSLAVQRGWEMHDLDPAVRFVTDRMIRLKLTGKNTDSEIAGLLIQGNTKGMISSLKAIHYFQTEDASLGILSRKLVDCAVASIQQLQSFL